MLHAHKPKSDFAPTMLRGWQAFSILAASVATSVAACGSSFQSVYEGDVRFEHCYRLDEESAVPAAQKLSCWEDWAARNSQGQTRDRAEYARMRTKILASGVDGLVAAAAPGSIPSAISCPMPASAFVSPPMTMNADGRAPAGIATPGTSGGAISVNASEPVASLAVPIVSEAGRGSNRPLSQPPAVACTATCAKAWSECGGGCRVSACRTTCDRGYRQCMRACF